MIKVAVLDDYQNIFKEFIDIDKYKSKFDFKIFNPGKFFIVASIFEIKLLLLSVVLIFLLKSIL